MVCLQERGVMQTWQGRARSTGGIAVLCLGLFTAPAIGQGLGGAGTVQGTVKDPTGGVMQAVEVKIANPVSGFTRTAATDAAGRYVFNNLPPNPYHVHPRRPPPEPQLHNFELRRNA